MNSWLTKTFQQFIVIEISKQFLNWIDNKWTMLVTLHKPNVDSYKMKKVNKFQWINSDKCDNYVMIKSMWCFFPYSFPFVYDFDRPKNMIIHNSTFEKARSNKRHWNFEDHTKRSKTGVHNFRLFSLRCCVWLMARHIWMATCDQVIIFITDNWNSTMCVKVTKRCIVWSTRK